jgi:DNA-binding NtrC family response regulator
VYGIIKQSGGYIWIESAEGKGATFRIYLPPARGPVMDAPAPAPPVFGPRRSATILLTEDEPDVRGLLRDMLTSSGYTVIEAENPADALAAAAARPEAIDLLLTDVVMPGGTGRALAREMAAIQPNLKVLYISGYPEHGTTPGSVLEPGVPFLPKPFTRQLLLENIRELLG